MSRFSLIVHLKDTSDIFYRDMLESIESQDFSDWDLYLIDDNSNIAAGAIAEEFFPEDDRVHYRKLARSSTRGYAINIGMHLVLSNEREKMPKDSYVYFIGQHDRLSFNALSKITDFLTDNQETDVFYTDYDELVGLERMNPHFMLGYNKELLRHKDYITCGFGINVDYIRRLGALNERLDYAAMYEYILRASERGAIFNRLDSLVYHVRQTESVRGRQNSKKHDLIMKEKMLAAQYCLKREGIDINIKLAKDGQSFDILYDGDDFYTHTRDYIMLKSKNVRSWSRGFERKLYGYLKQKDVAIVGAKMLRNRFDIHSVGYIFDEYARLYPAFYDTRTYQKSFDGLATTPHDCSAVDFSFCMIDARVYRKLGGFDKKLSGRDRILDFCFRAKKAGFRCIVATDVIAKIRGDISDDSTEASANIMMEKYEDILKKGDPYYHPMLAVGLDNYKILVEE